MAGLDPAIQALCAQERKAAAHVVIARSEATRQSSAFSFLACFAEPVIGQAAGLTRWLAMTPGWPKPGHDGVAAAACARRWPRALGQSTANLKRAHALLESGKAKGKVVPEGFGA